MISHASPSRNIVWSSDRSTLIGWFMFRFSPTTVYSTAYTFRATNSTHFCYAASGKGHNQPENVAALTLAPVNIWALKGRAEPVAQPATPPQEARPVFRLLRGRERGGIPRGGSNRIYRGIVDV
jgi:hypothetical protein